MQLSSGVHAEFCYVVPLTNIHTTIYTLENIAYKKAYGWKIGPQKCESSKCLFQTLVIFKKFCLLSIKKIKLVLAVIRKLTGTSDSYEDY